MSENKKKIRIAIDPGFDGAKIVINKTKLHIPLVVMEITNFKKEFDLKRDKRHRVIITVDNRTFLLGWDARLSLDSEERRKGNKELMELFYTMGRFKSREFDIALKGLIAYALVEYNNLTSLIDLEHLDLYDLQVAIALPNDHVEQFSEILEGYLQNTEEVKIAIRDNKEVTLEFKPSLVYFSSQGYVTLLNEAIDDEGYDIEGKSIYNYLPALVINAGYKTVETFVLEKDESITKIESNTDYAMKVINERVAAYMRGKGAEYYDYMVEMNYTSEDIIYTKNVDGKALGHNIKELRDEYLADKAKEFISYLAKKHNDFLGVKYILVTGGTGSQYFPYIEKHINEYTPHISEFTSLPKAKFDGKQVEPLYSVAVGIYKDLMANTEE